jgi:hypothetical protein
MELIQTDHWCVVRKYRRTSARLRPTWREVAAIAVDPAAYSSWIAVRRSQIAGRFLGVKSESKREW